MNDDWEPNDAQVTFRDAVSASNERPGADVIEFAPQVEGVIFLNNFSGDSAAPFDIVITDSLEIRGPGSGRLAIDGNDATRQLRVENTAVTISGLTFQHGNARSSGNIDGQGGALYNNAGRLTLDRVIVKENNAFINGGGIFNVSRDDDVATLDISHSIITDNTTNTGNGGGIYNLRGELQITDSAILANVVSPATAIGGGIISEEGQAVIRTTTIAGNHAGLDGGGAIFLEGVSKIINSTIGGAEDSEGNSAGRDGGGLSAVGTDLYLYGTTVSHNHSQGSGGGVFAGPRSNEAMTIATIANSTISTNAAGTKGGGLHLEVEFAEVVSNAIAYNSASSGGGIFIANAAGNQNRDVEMHNTIIAHNTANQNNDISGQVCTSPLAAAPEGACRFASSYNLVSDADSAGGMTSDPPNAETSNKRFNLVGRDPQLLPLDFYGGHTMTHALESHDDVHSPALNAGFWTFMILADGSRIVSQESFLRATDQRGVTRSNGVGTQLIDIGAYELDRTITRHSSLESFELKNHSQFDTGSAHVGDSIFRGAAFDLDEWTLGGFDSAKTGFQATIDPRPFRFGIEAGYSLDKGSIDARYDADLAISFEDPAALGKVRIEELVGYDYAQFTTSSDVNVGAYLDLIAEMGVDLQLEACILGGCLDSGVIELPLNLANEIIAVNRDNDGELRILGRPTIPGAQLLRNAVPQVPYPDLPAAEGKLYENKTVKVEYESALVGCTAGAQGTGCGAELDLKIKQKQTGAKRTIEFGSAAVKFPRLESLHANTPGADGQLSASSAASRLAPDDPWQDKGITELPDSFLGAAALQVGALAGGVLTTQKIDLGFAALEFTPLSLEVGPVLYVEQQADVLPVNEITYRFDRPVTVYVGGINATPQVVREVTLPVQELFEIGFDGSVVEVTPEWHFGLDLHNQIDLVTELKGLLTVLDIGIDLDGAIDAVLGAIGLDIDDLDPDPLYQKELLDLQLPPIHVLNEVIPLLRKSVMMEPFVIGENFQPGLLVTRPDDGGAGSLRSAVLNANLLAEQAPNDPEIPVQDTYGIKLGPGNYVLDVPNSEDSQFGGDLDIETNITIVGAGAENTFISAEGLFDRIFDIHPGASLNLVGVTLLGGSPDESNSDGVDGGSIRNQGSLTLDDVQIRGASTLVGREGRGGAIFNAPGAALTMTDSVLQNSAAFLGGAIYNAGVATIDSSTFGAIGLTTNDVGDTGRTNVFLTNCTTQFCNRADAAGGGIYNEQTGSLTLLDSTLADNYAQNGGGLWNGGNLTIQGSTISANNTAAGGNGAGIDNAGSLEITRSTLSLNRAADGSGGAIFSDISGTQDDRLTLLHVTVFDNRAEGGNGGGVFITGGPYSIQNSIIAGNVAQDNHNTNVMFARIDRNYVGDDPLLTTLGSYGGKTLTHALQPASPAINLADPDLLLRGPGNILLPDQRGVSWMTADSGSVAYTATEVTITANGPLSLRQAVTVLNVQGNADSDGDGDLTDELNTIYLQPGIYALSEAEFLTLADSAAQGDLDVSGQRLRILGAGAGETIIDASAIRDRVFDVHAGATLSLEGVTIRGGLAPQGEVGGGIRNAGTLSLTEVIVTDNSATTGGGIFNAQAARLSVAASMISENRSQWGGGIHNQGILDVTASSLMSNQAIGAAGHDGQRSLVDGGGEGGGGGGGGAGIGGALLNDGGTVTMVNTTVALNTATGGGGGHGVDNTQRRAYSDGGDGGGPNAGRGGTIRYETRYAEPGGFGSGGGGGNSGFNVAPINNLPPGGDGGFAGGGGGGGAYTRIASTTCPGAAGGQAGMHAGAGGQGTRGPDTGNPNLTIGNTSAGGGGGGGAGLGAGIFSRTGSITILNSTIYDNLAEGGAGGLGGQYIDPDNPSVTGDPAQPGEAGQGAGGGIYIHSGTAEIGNTIVAANAADDSPDTIGSFQNDGGNLIGFNPQLGPFRPAGVTLFAEPRDDSLAINNGNTDLVAGLSTDQRGDPRVKNGAVDIGAVEVLDVIEEFTATQFEDKLEAPSLRQLLIDTNAMRGEQIIYLKEGTYTLTLQIPSDIQFDRGTEMGDLDILDDIMIIGDGIGETIIDASGLNDRIFDIFVGNRFHLSNLTLTGGSPRPNDGNLGSGGAIWNWGNATLENVEITASTAVDGGAIHNNGPMTIINSLLHDNEATDQGGAIFGHVQLINTTISGNRARKGGGIYGGMVGPAPTGSLTSVTIADNFATEHGGGIVNGLDQEFMIKSTIVAGNSAPTAPDVDGLWESLGYNLFGAGAPPTQVPSDLFSDDPQFGPLQDNGSPILTHALLPGSPAINSGDPTAMAAVGDTPEFDQRGFRFGRVIDERIDIGAYEYQAAHELFGDYNGDGIVDAVDYTRWRDTLGQWMIAYTGADGNGNGIVDKADYSVWKSNYGATVIPDPDGPPIDATEPGEGYDVIDLPLSTLAASKRVTYWERLTSRRNALAHRLRPVDEYFAGQFQRDDELLMALGNANGESDDAVLNATAFDVAISDEEAEHGLAENLALFLGV